MFLKILYPIIFLYNLLKKKNKVRKSQRNYLKKKNKINLIKKYIQVDSIGINKIFFYSSNNLFSELCEKYGTDKGFLDFKKKTPYGWKAHTYNTVYNSLFDHCRKNLNLVFECGIGSNFSDVESNMSPNGKPGASLRVWRDYFPSAMIYGADIDKRILFSEERIKTYQVDQTNSESIKKMWEKINQNNFDLIIDDGLHNLNASTMFFFNSFDKLKSGGIYIIEDVDFSYMNELKNKLNNYRIEVICLNNEYYKEKLITNNNLIIIRKK
ncbi:hypothetical protein OAT25_01595 [Candidatus Pelagibacter sp.]|nr:hypothetical protein [Candidatus Pelagibacter sp.]